MVSLFCQMGFLFAQNHTNPYLFFNMQSHIPIITHPFWGYAHIQNPVAIQFAFMQYGCANEWIEPLLACWAPEAHNWGDSHCKYPHQWNLNCPSRYLVWNVLWICGALQNSSFFLWSSWMGNRIRVVLLWWCCWSWQPVLSPLACYA